MIVYGQGQSASSGQGKSEVEPELKRPERSRGGSASRGEQVWELRSGEKLTGG